ncbi:ribbon-helix-helix domain-containing protein [Microbacterium sp. NIBRBAC000506063]|uniref:ribbon-helix-helix domain-containing protein n=1 Tax=Microbacterium sp. NIBRBAC000506063 TaxID=2734618 RepID=UPI001BB4A123|nr:CopG family transcriptional regulator [Microbacterium sp. NIBRBAC000506063]
MPCAVASELPLSPRPHHPAPASRGRPGRGASPSQVVALRLTIDELAAIDARATREHKTRSEAIRDALKSYVA